MGSIPTTVVSLYAKEAPERDTGSSSAEQKPDSKNDQRYELETPGAHPTVTTDSRRYQLRQREFSTQEQ